MTFNQEKPIPVLEPGEILHYWDMATYMPAKLSPGRYITTCGRTATVEHVTSEGDAFGYIQRYGAGPSLCCVWTWDGLIRCAFRDDDYDAWEWSIIDPLPTQTKEE